MSAHEKGIEAAGRDWLQQTGMLLINDEFESAVRAYLEASGQVLVPKEPTEGMLHQAYECDVKYVDETSSPSEYWAAMIAAYPQPFSQDKT